MERISYSTEIPHGNKDKTREYVQICFTLKKNICNIPTGDTDYENVSINPILQIVYQNYPINTPQGYLCFYPFIQEGTVLVMAQIKQDFTSSWAFASAAALTTDLTKPLLNLQSLAKTWP